MVRQPVLFLSHGGGPSYYLDAKLFPRFKGMDKDSRAADYLRNLAKTININKPKAVLVLSAHWEENACTVQVTDSPTLYYDFGGFPPEMYNITWSVPGAADVAKQTKILLESKGIKCEENNTRGLDHGVFVPLKMVFPEADIPVFQVSLLKSSNIEDNLKIGEALRDLASDNILIIGSGFATHAGLRDETTAQWSKDFQVWLNDVLCNPDYSADERKSRILQVTAVPSFKEAHPTLDHFLPIVMCSAAAGYKAGKLLYSEFLKSLLNEHYLF